MPSPAAVNWQALGVTMLGNVFHGIREEETLDWGISPAASQPCDTGQLKTWWSGLHV